MNIKRSYFHGLLAAVTVGLLLANCTVKESNGDECTKGDKNSGCECPGGLVGYQVCNSEGVFGSCVCPSGNSTSGSGSGGSSSNNNEGGSGNETSSGASSGAGTTGGTSSMNEAGAGGAISGEAGAGGAGTTEMFDPNDCEACLAVLCKDEYDACLTDEQCFSEMGDGSGQYERIAACIIDQRASGLVKRDVVRGCGVTIGASPDPDLQSAWAPEGMADTTTNLLNCMATSSKETPNADWANSDENFPIVDDMVMPTPWPSDSCAKLACTSKFE